MKKIIIIDYKVGNILSIHNAIKFLNYKAYLSNNKKKVSEASHIILPGVGAFPAAMDKLKKYDLIDPIHTAVRNGSKILGICLGMQLLFDISDEQNLD